jgi:hypothetical protein
MSMPMSTAHAGFSVEKRATDLLHQFLQSLNTFDQRVVCPTPKL